MRQPVRAKIEVRTPLRQDTPDLPPARSAKEVQRFGSGALVALSEVAAEQLGYLMNALRAGPVYVSRPQF